MADRMPTVAVIGLGAFGRAHLQAYVRAGARIAAVADRDPDLAHRTAEEFDVPASFTDAVELLDAVPIDGVSVVTSAASHVELAREATLRGCKVLLEKPIATTAAELATLPDAARSRILPGHVLRFAPLHQRLRTEIASGRIGAVRGVAAGRSRTRDHQRLYADVHPARMTGIHDIDLVTWLTGSPIRRVVASVDGEPTSLVQAHLLSASGIASSIRVSWLLPDGAGAEDELEVYGQEGVARLRVDSTGAVLYGQSRERPWAVAPPTDTPGLDAEISHFLRWLRDDVEPLVTFAAAAHAVAVADAIVASGTAGGTPIDVLEVPSWTKQ
ncbi:Gfo/Idh/MocA family protein [Micromonospora echinofusca]|uniref:Gfo/Idh/MocA family oxidoreductase n=1 Tax=Micromonospora echinofusca TaxID=47858 RepID=A0ABS3VL39_MICEH|nr:Gfo/Idh/MocA family oxidoreductase [Micromonospora echinofusca]MBO4205198.1 Gfo/Idh/MocA family oxidoreductase [Micromonospora echinofusca]